MATYREIIQGFQIQMGLEEKGSETHIGGAEHDVIFGSNRRIEDESLVQRLGELGWFWSEEHNCWAHFV
jgi:hypothetical protein